MKNSIIWGIVLVLVLVAGGVYYSSTQKVEEVAVVENEVVNNTLTSEENTNTNPDQKNLAVVSAESKATYKINEELRGTPTLVTGNTTAITGSITVDVANKKIVTGKIEIDANTFATDIPARDENVKKLVLESDKNKTITFVPTNIEGVLEVGKSSNVKIAGAITIKGITKPVTLTGTAILNPDNSLALSVKTVLTYGDFGVTIPDFPFLANIDKTVDLSVDLVAR